MLNSIPVPCGQSRETVKRSELAGSCGYGYCAAHSRHFWGYRLFLLCSPDGMPARFELFAATSASVKQPQRCSTAWTSLAIALADKGFAGAAFEQFIHSLDADFRRPDRAGEAPRFGSLGQIRQWIESIFWTCKGQLALERHGGRTVQGVAVRIALRLLALSADIWHNWQIGQPSHELAAYNR